MGLVLINGDRIQATIVFTDYELTEADHGQVLVFDSPTNVFCKIPLGLREAFYCTVIQRQTGKVYFKIDDDGDISSVNGALQTGLSNGPWTQAKLQGTKFNQYSVEFGAIGGGSISLPNPYNGFISGNATWTGVGLIFDVSILDGFILGAEYISPPEQWELAPADPTYSRIDLIVLNDSGESEVITGTPAPSPIKPVIDPDTQLELTFILVAAGATIPTNIVNDIIYDEHVEWECGAFSVALNSYNVFDQTDAPQNGAKCISVIGFERPDALQFTKGSILNVGNYNFLRFYMRVDTRVPFSTFPFDAQFAIDILFKNGAAVVGGGVQVVTGTYGFDTTVDGWQLVVIPLTALTFTNPNFDSILFNFSGITLSAFSLDVIELQGPPINSNLILTSQLGNRFLVSVFEDEEGNGILQTTKLDDV